MHRILPAFLVFLGLLIVGLLLPPVWSSAAYSCAGSGLWCAGWLVAFALTGVIVTGLAALYQLMRTAEPAESEKKDHGSAFPHGGTLETGVWLIAILALYVYLFFKVLVPETIDENAIFWLELMDSQLITETAVAFLAAGIGAIAATFHSYLRHAANRGDWKRQFIPWYILRPFLGSILGVIFFWLMRGGILAVLPADNGRDYLELDLNGLAGICALVGMFSRRALLKLRETFTVIFVLKDPSNADDPGSRRKRGDSPDDSE